MIIGAAGHIDHGKTSLVKAVTGVDADRLKEEKERGITIDLGFAYWPQDDGSVIGFVDVPGHERFVHTMLAGAQGVDLVLLVVAADDGVMPQTREHLEIIELLGLSRAVVALTKIDAVDPARVAEVANEIATLLAPTPLADSPVFPVSSVTRAGIGALEEALRDAARGHAARAQSGAFRLAVDRVFILQGAGVVVTGMTLDGTARVGDEIVLSPSGLAARVRSVHAQNRKAGVGRAGERCALNLIGPDIAKDAIARGDMALTPASHAPTRRIDAELSISPGLKKGLTQWMPARLHHATAEVGARIVLLDDATGPGESARVQLVLDQPIAARARDRFVLRDVSASRTIGGGRFIDLRAPERKRRTPERHALLDALARDDPREALAGCLAGPPGYVDLEIFARDRGGLEDEIESWRAATDCVELRAGGRRYGLADSCLAALQNILAEKLAAFHRANPDRPGSGLEALRMQTAPAMPAPLFREVLRLFGGKGPIVVDGNWARLTSHRLELSPADENLWSEIAPRLLGAARFRPPRVRDIARATGENEEKLRKLFKRVARRGDLYEIAPDHYFPRATIAETARIARRVEAESGGWFVVGPFRDLLEADGQIVGRKVAIQILEFFDRHGVAIRRGDNRRMNPHRLDLFERGEADKQQGGESLPVERPDFKSGWGRETVSGGFDSHSLPPTSGLEVKHAGRD